MLNYQLLYRDADGEPTNNQNGAAETDSGAIKAALDSAIDLALERAESGTYELWIQNRRIAIIEVNSTDAESSPPSRPDKLHFWSHLVRRKR